MPSEDIVAWGWYFIFGLAVLAAIIAFFTFFRPSIDSGPLTALASALSWLVKPLV